MPIIRQKIKPDSIIYSDCLKSYDALDISEFHHHRINHSKLFAKGKNHINGVENSWNQAKRRMSVYNGINKNSFKECEFKFNNPGAINQFKLLEKLVKLYLKQGLI